MKRTVLFTAILAAILSFAACSETVDTLSNPQKEKAKFDQTKMDKSTFGK